MLARHVGLVPAAELRIRKSIPVAGGMAGGSADAAAALLACNELWSAGLTRDELIELAADLGSDVPFALLGGTAVGLGRGEQLTSALVRGASTGSSRWPTVGCPTPAVYAEWRPAAGRHDRPAWPRTSSELMAALATGDAQALGKALTNDLQPAALTLRPRCAAPWTPAGTSAALGALVSGSGPTCAFLAESESHALDLSIGLEGGGVARAVVRAHGPVHGATIV